MNTIGKTTGFPYVRIFFRKKKKQAPAELEKDATHKSLIEVVFSVNTYFFMNIFDFYLLPSTFFLHAVSFYLLYFTFYLLHFTLYIFTFYLLPF